MFTVKATYRGETRKFIFPECNNSFPSYYQIFNQLYRVFPLSDGCYLSKVLLSPDGSKARVLVAREVHSALQYINAISQFRSRSFPNPLLRFTILEPSQPLSISAPRDFTPQVPLYPQVAPAPIPFISQNSPQSFHPFVVPPPPIIFSAPTSRASSQASIDFNRFTPLPETSRGVPLAQPGLVPPQAVPSCHSCCAATDARHQIETMIAEFKEELDAVLVKSFGTASSFTAPLHDAFGSRTPSVATATPPPAPYSPMCLSKMCTTCSKLSQGPWYACTKCNLVMCPSCASRDADYCAMDGFHTLHRKTCVACPKENSGTAPNQPSWLGGITYPALGEPRVESVNTPSFNPPVGAPPLVSPLTSVEQVSEIPRPVSNAVTPIIHNGVMCDECNKTIEGIRHKCVDCADFDLCSACMLSGGADRHELYNPFHVFFDVTKPGCVMRPDRTPNLSRPLPRSPPSPVAVPVHAATCDFCDSRIRGVRYKCCRCPDFDTCEPCFSITQQHHPNHSFIRIQSPTDYLITDGPPPQQHFATCDSCSKTIFGVRYKCMHPECPDFDLCEVCEAHPIAVHPPNHAFLKMVAPDTVVPTVYRVGQTQLFRDMPPASSNATAPSQVTPSPSAKVARPGIKIREYSQLLDQNSRSPKVEQPKDLVAQHYQSVPQCSTSPELEQPRNSLVEYYELMRQHSTSPKVVLPSKSNRETNGLTSGSSTLRTQAPTKPRSFIAEKTPQSSSAPIEKDEWMKECFAWSSKGVPYAPPKPDYGGLYSGSSTPQSRPSLPSFIIDRAPKKTDSEVPKGPSFVWKNFPGEFSPQPAFNPFQDGPFSDKLAVPVTPTDVYIPGLPSVDVPTVKEPNAPVIPPLVEESPLTGGEALLSHPVANVQYPEVNRPQRQPTLAELLRSVPSSPFEHSVVNDASPAQVTTEPLLAAEFLADVTVPDGQVFPPGAEFMKCWRLVNTGERAWPASTELVYISGHDLGAFKEKRIIPVGFVAPNAKADLWTSELKAPEQPGRYTSYWRLRSETGELFGDRIWIEIVVEEPRESVSSSMTSSSMMIMPQAPGVPSTLADATSTIGDVPGTTTRRSSVGHASTRSAGSRRSTISLLSVPSSSEPDDEDAELYVQSRSEVRGVANGAEDEYVVLYDEASSDDEFDARA